MSIRVGLCYDGVYNKKSNFQRRDHNILYLFRPVSFPVKATGNVSKSTMSVKQSRKSIQNVEL